MAENTFPKWLTAALLVLIGLVLLLLALVGWQMFRPMSAEDYRAPQSRIFTALDTSRLVDAAVQVTYDPRTALDEAALKNRVNNSRTQLSTVVKNFSDVKGKRAVVKDGEVARAYADARKAIDDYDKELTAYAKAYPATGNMVRLCTQPDLAACEESIVTAEKVLKDDGSGLPEQRQLAVLERAYIDRAKAADGDITALLAEKTSPVQAELVKASSRLDTKAKIYQDALQKLLNLLRQKEQSA